MKQVMYCCKKDAEFQLDTLEYFRKSSILKLLINSSMTWDEVKQYGWTCVKVELTLTEI